MKRPRMSIRPEIGPGVFASSNDKMCMTLFTHATVCSPAASPKQVTV
jgi:hypothetical protein